MQLRGARHAVAACVRKHVQHVRGRVQGPGNIFVKEYLLRCTRPSNCQLVCPKSLQKRQSMRKGQILDICAQHGTIKLL